MKNNLVKSEAWLRRKYLLDKLSAQEIAALSGISVITVYRYIERYGLKR